MRVKPNESVGVGVIAGHSPTPRTVDSEAAGDEQGGCTLPAAPVTRAGIECAFPPCKDGSGNAGLLGNNTNVTTGRAIYGALGTAAVARRRAQGLRDHGGNWEGEGGERKSGAARGHHGCFNSEAAQSSWLPSGRYLRIIMGIYGSEVSHSMRYRKKITLRAA